MSLWALTLKSRCPNIDWLVVLTILKKYEFVNGKDDIPYMMKNNPFMFETTNQYTIKYNLQILLTIQ